MYALQIKVPRLSLSRRCSFLSTCPLRSLPSFPLGKEMALPLTGTCFRPVSVMGNLSPAGARAWLTLQVSQGSSAPYLYIIYSLAPRGQPSVSYFSNLFLLAEVSHFWSITEQHLITDGPRASTLLLFQTVENLRKDSKSKKLSTNAEQFSVFFSLSPCRETQRRMQDPQETQRIFPKLLNFK